CPACRLGMKQRLAIAPAMLRDPGLLILAEPTNGLDPAGIREIRDLVRSIASLGPTVFLSSHLLHEIQSVCEWIVVIEQGGLVYEGRTAQLLAGAEQGFVVDTDDRADLETIVQLARGAGHDADVRDGRAHVRAPKEYITELSRAAADRGVVLTEITPVQASLEDRFFELTRRES